MAYGKQIKGFLVANGINQNVIAKDLKLSDSTFSDKLNENVKISLDEYVDILKAINKVSKFKVDANYFVNKVEETQNNNLINNEN